MASAQGDEAGIVVTGLRRRVRMVAPWKGSCLERVVGEEGLDWGVGGRRSLAASQSSSTNLGILDRA